MKRSLDLPLRMPVLSGTSVIGIRGFIVRLIWLKGFCALLLFAATACRADEKGPSRNAELVEEPGEPDYGDEAAVKGYYVWGFETSALYRCRGTRRQCVSEAALEHAGCWIEFTKEGYDQLSKLRLNDDGMLEGGEIWIEGLGRIASQPGNFGHLGSYSCQIQLTHVSKVDPGSPHLFRPPEP